MINLRLAEYDRDTWKFKQFLELDSHSGDETEPTFGFYKDYIEVSWYDRPIVEKEFKEEVFELDKEDPLKRFDGWFDGRTYGGGKFVLMHQCFDEYYEEVVDFYQDDITRDRFTRSIGILMGSGRSISELTVEHLGDLHQNPELYEAMKEE